MCFVCAGFRKKLEGAAKNKDCSLIGDWQRSIINHLYWCVASTDDGDSETILAKWLSADNHEHNVHTHESAKFGHCVHGHTSKRKWFTRRKCNSSVTFHNPIH
jgi:solute carrier family 8 (sodium/calcium exchanger)